MEPDRHGPAGLDRRQQQQTEKKEEGEGGQGAPSIEEPFARGGATQAGDAVQAADFALELVVVGQLLVCRAIWVSIDCSCRRQGRDAAGGRATLTLRDIPQRVDDDPLAPLHLDDLGRAVGHA